MELFLSVGFWEGLELQNDVGAGDVLEFLPPMAWSYPTLSKGAKDGSPGHLYQRCNDMGAPLKGAPISPVILG